MNEHLLLLIFFVAAILVIISYELGYRRGEKHGIKKGCIRAMLGRPDYVQRSKTEWVKPE